jgi:hypothetical protein
VIIGLATFQILNEVIEGILELQEKVHTILLKQFLLNINGKGSLLGNGQKLININKNIGLFRNLAFQIEIHKHLIHQLSVLVAYRCEEQGKPAAVLLVLAVVQLQQLLE